MCSLHSLVCAISACPSHVMAGTSWFPHWHKELRYSVMDCPSGTSGSVRVLVSKVIVEQLLASWQSPQSSGSGISCTVMVFPL